MNTETSCNEGKAKGAEGGTKVDKTKGVQVWQLRENQLQDAKVDDEFLQGLPFAAVGGISLSYCLRLNTQVNLKYITCDWY